MTKSIKYSVIVAVYNRPKEIQDLLNSISNQKFKDFEVIIVDDGSEKSSREIIDFIMNNYLSPMKS